MKLGAQYVISTQDPDAPFDLNSAARDKGVELPKLPGLPDFTLPKLGNDLREIELPDAVADCVEINQCVGGTRQFFTKSFLILHSHRHHANYEVYRRAFRPGEVFWDTEEK